MNARRSPNRYRPNRRHCLARARAGGGHACERHDYRRQAASSGLANPSSATLLRLTPSASVVELWTGGFANRSPHPRRRGQPHLAVHRRHSRERPGNREPAPFRTPECRHRLAHRGRPRASVGIVGIGSDRRRRGRQRARRRQRLRRVRGRRLVRLSASRGFRFRIIRKGQALPPPRGGSARTGSTASQATATRTDIATYPGVYAATGGSVPISSLAPQGSRSIGAANSTALTPHLPSSTPTHETAAATV